MSSNHKSSHAQWGSRVGFILAATGSAVGLGNIWKFPYMTGQSGGSAFVLTYLLCIAFIGLPILVAEWLIGRRGQKNPIHAMEDVAQQNRRSKAWKLVGVSGVLGSFLILSFYSVIGGWAVDYIFITASGAFNGMDGQATESLFTGFLGNPSQLLTWHSIFMLLTVVIVAMGVSGGLERASKLMMPALALVLLVLVAYGAFFTNSFGAAAAYLFSPNWSAINGTVILAALGHAFFTLSLGMGIMMAYGSYLGQEVNLIKTARTVVILDTVIALFAGLAIFPLVFAHHLEPSSGPGLIFITLPIAFGNMTGGTLLGVLFFILLTFAALTSSISLLEPTVELLEEKTPLSRKAATAVAGGAIWLLGIACLLSFNSWSDVMIFGNNIFDALDKLTSKLMLPLTGLATIIFAGWFMNQESIRQELGLSGAAYTVWKIVSRFIAPIGVIIVFVASLLG
ncbi:sodium-dependent transporter [Uruburuella suis]|jgi:NSS family neurotransmitter:Na+ symporter|uniref:NSS family neurotransmitter:Na+ symporter n=1 Tax=Uruburuella suis TaxID=252130 RepID=A0AAE9KFN1_9NEIS|nr:sodium-dependent transporter [Uruburuella suis]MBP7258128.1 sodium-dependent transporter [Neisseria sp.]MBP8043180.1 sodium-dependent transporter [Neisseria sp.]MBP8875685.1 sodium-dependent transporter [Neisseria sp.]TCP10508.1 NSS family neurotransmitter:Na+ symporter [Uruburuella suis]UOO78376.1 sodium-dependent transporter [Uruburuella suis]